MPVRQKTKTQYVEHYEEHVGEEMKPFVALLPTQETQVEKNASNTSPANADSKLNATAENKRKTRFWRRITAFFS
ncbi:MAG: hypothetical protein ACK4TA_14680 [Saprospiraceae bacterium]